MLACFPVISCFTIIPILRLIRIHRIYAILHPDYSHQVHFSGKKWSDKLYRWHTGYPGGLRERPAKDMLERKPESILKKAILGMLYRNNLREGYMEPRLKIYAGPDHPHRRAFGLCRCIRGNATATITSAWGAGIRKHRFKWGGQWLSQEKEAFEITFIRDGGGGNTDILFVKQMKS